MMIDKVGGIGPNYGPKRTEPTAKVESTARGADNVVISEEASRAADVARTVRMVHSTQDPERAEKLKVIRERLDRGEYDNLSDDQLSTIADSILSNFTGVATETE